MAGTSYLKNATLEDKMPESWDVETCHEGEDDLHTNLTSCQKHPDHQEFIPVDTFDITHLPADYQDSDIVEYIKLMAQLTVRLAVRYVSPDRPATVHGTDKPYPFCQNRGRYVMSVGTGLITAILANRGRIVIKTAAHVIFDKQEAQHASCHLFYDNGHKPSACKTAVELKCTYDLVYSNTITDESVLRCVTDDDSLLQKLQSIILRSIELQSIIKDRFVKNSDTRQKQPLTFIVSHPHGCSKTISIGRCKEVDDNLDDVRFLYTTPTCPGSSGAAVICLDKRAWNLRSAHSGACKNDQGLNLSSGRYCPSYVSLLEGWGSWSSPENQHHPDARQTDAWPASSPLPPEFRFNLVIDYIRVLSYLTVNVDVKYVSEQRPEFWPGSRRPYPWYDKKRSREQRWGRGWVDTVDIYPNTSSPDKTCDCDICRNSSTPERKFAHFFIVTSTSLVFDQLEGKTSKCFLRLSRLYELSLHQPVCSNVDTDRSQLVFVTHDVFLAGKYKTSLERGSFLKEKIQEKLSNQLPEIPICLKINRYMVPSIGHCVSEGKHLVYTNEAEQGDVGAPVIVLGKNHFHYDISGHTGEYPQDPSLGYSIHPHYKYE